MTERLVVRFRFTFVVLSALAGLLPAAAVAAPQGDPEQGKSLLTANCSRCHAVGMTGESQHEKAPPFRQVVTRYPVDNLEEALAEGIMSGHPDMPEFSFTAGEIASILAYLDGLKPAPETPLSPPPKP
jgi:cytochrome c